MCPKCQTPFPERYSNDVYCKECRKVANNRWREKNAARVSLKARLRRYGLSVQQYEAMVLRARGHCECCGDEFTEEPHIEHNHATKVVRGLVCRRCNYAIAVVEDERLLHHALTWKLRHDT